MNEAETRITARINTEIAAQTPIASNGAMAFGTMDKIMEFAKIMAIASVAIPKHLRENVGACLAVAIQASEWQMSPFAVANKTYVVNDRIGYEAQLINAVILRRAPIVGRLIVSYTGDGQSRKCKVSARLTAAEGGEMVEYESPTIATIPTKNSPLWKGDPDQQLFYYSSRAMCRRHFPDVILGVYTADELQDAEPMMARVVEIKPCAIGTLAEEVELTTPAVPTEEPREQLEPVKAAPVKAVKPAAPKPEPQSSPMDASEPQSEDQPEKPAEKAPDTEKLRAQLKNKCALAGIGKGRLTGHLCDSEFLPAGTTFEAMTAMQITATLDVWEQIVAEIKA